MSHTTKHSRSLAPLYINSMSQSRSFNEPQIIGQYRLIKTIGKGNFAKVKLARHLPTDRLVAIKIIDKTRLSASSLQKLFREVRIMKTLDHPNIVKLYEVIENEKCLFLIMEYASRGEIFDFLVANGRMKEKDVRSKFRQILSSVHYCHQKGIVHRDLKAENLLLDRDLSIKIADFGFSNEFKPGCKLDTFCGSPPYAAPELFQGKKYDGPEVDVWSMGVILYTLISGSLPFDGSNLKELRERVLKGKYRVPFYMSSECESFLKKFLVINPSKRITLENAMKEKWINNGFDGCGDMEAYKETPASLDEKRVATMVKMGINRTQIEESLNLLRFDKIYATYHLLGITASHQTVGCDLPTHLSGPVLQNSHRSSPRWREEQRVVVPSSRQVVVGGTSSHVGRQANYILPPPPPLPITATIPSVRHQNNNQFEMASCIVPPKQPPTTFSAAATTVTTTNAFDLPDAVNGTLPRKISDDGKERTSQRVSRSMTYSHRRTHSVNAGHTKGHTAHNNSSPPSSTFNPLSMKSNKMSTLHHQPSSDADKTLSSSPAPPLSVPCNITVINNSFVSTPRNVWTTRNSSRSAPGSRFPRQPPPRQATVPAGGTIGRPAAVETADVLTPPPRGDGKNSSGGGAVSFFSKLTSKFRK